MSWSKEQQPNIASFAPMLLLKSYKKVLAAVGRANTILILSVVYWAILPIFALIFKFKKRAVGGSTWRTKEADFPKSYEQQF